LGYYSGYGFPDFDGDANDYWRVEIEDHNSKDVSSGERLKAIRTIFRLVHINEGCALYSHSVKCKFPLCFTAALAVCMDSKTQLHIQCQSGASSNKKSPASKVEQSQRLYGTLNKTITFFYLSLPNALDMKSPDFGRSSWN
jgi:dolichyl-phosphate-mannose--protein O-mannosyl transferase